MYLVMRGNLVPIRDAHYGYAETIVGAQRRALSFFIDNGEGTLEHARREGIDVSECY
jgi:hypothetical protein